MAHKLPRTHNFSKTVVWSLAHTYPDGNIHIMFHDRVKWFTKHTEMMEVAREVAQLVQVILYRIGQEADFNSLEIGLHSQKNPYRSMWYLPRDLENLSLQLQINTEAHLCPWVH